jgi:ribonucleoside-triphosphate reductase (thioredoxin)
MASEYALEAFSTLFQDYPFLTQELDFPLPSSYQSFIALTQYSRYIDGLNRRETWQETVFRFLDYINYQTKEHLYQIDTIDMYDIYTSIMYLSVFPSMRLLRSAGDAVKKNACSNYNCTYLPISDTKAFTELMFLSMSGCGVGFSVENENVKKLPTIPTLYPGLYKTKVEDSRESWVLSFVSILDQLYTGRIPEWDLSELRPKGVRLKTAGGYSSGPDPLDRLFRFVVEKFKNAQGRKLTPLECHDICCMIGEIGVSGAIRRAALISYSDLDDFAIRDCKSGKWYKEYPYRALANNSAVYKEGVTEDHFWSEWKALQESRSGERGIFGEVATKNKIKSLVRRDPNFNFRGNPCQEICLRPYQMCNLSNVVVRANDTVITLLKKIRIATILGTIQSTITHFDEKLLRPEWKNNCDEERLLGVSLTGIANHPLLFSNSEWTKGVLNTLRNEAISTNVTMARNLRIPRSAAITCLKPSGDSSQLANSSSGIHPCFSPYYIRRVRLSKSDPVAQWMIDQSFPFEDDVYTTNTYVFSFPVVAPNGKYQKDISAIEHAEIWKRYKDDYTEHTVSCTISVKEDEWDDLGKWVHKNIENISGLSFLPLEDHSYQQMPYETISEEEYYKMKGSFPSLDVKNFREEEDTTSDKPLFACTGNNSCEL